jgi:hypothetical protein
MHVEQSFSVLLSRLSKEQRLRELLCPTGRLKQETPHLPPQLKQARLRLKRKVQQAPRPELLEDN